MLALPALLLTAVLGTGLGGGGGGGGSTSSGADPDWSFLLSGGGLVAVCGILGWFAALALGRMPSGLRNLAGYGLGYSAQTYAYLLFLTDAYPNSDPGASGPPWGLPAHAIRVETDDDGRRSRLTVLFRFLLALPHLVWLMLWSVLALLAGFVNGVHALVRGRSAAPLHRFLAAYVRYSAHVTAFISIVANRFPGFTGEPGYAVDIAIAPLERQNRWVTLFRGLLAIPAFLVSGALAVVLGAIGFLGWFAALATGRMPTGLRRLGVIAVRYLAQTNAYWLILTDDYPHASPAVAAPGGEQRAGGGAARVGAGRPGAGRRGGRLTRSSRLARTLGLLALATAWAFAASSLWQTRVPDGLARPDLAARPLFDASLLERAETYERFLRADFVASQLVLLVVLALYAWRGAAFARESAAGRIGTGMLLGMIGLALVWLSQVPFRLVETWWNRRYDQTDAGYLETLLENWLVLGAEFLFICLTLVIVMALAGRWPRRWWLAAAPAFVCLAALFAFVTPYLFPTEPAGATLQQDARRFAHAQETETPRISVQDVSDFTDAPNAFAAGFGPSRRVVLWSTLLDGRFRDRRGERRPGARARPPLAQPHPGGARLVRALRPPGRMADRGRHAAAGRNAQPRRRADLAPRARQPPARRAPAAELDLAAHGGGGGLGRARDDARSRRCAGALRQVHDARALRSGSTRLVGGAARQPSLRARADRARRGLARPEPVGAGLR